MASRLSSFFTKATKAIKSLDVQHGKPVVAITEGCKTVIPLAVTSLLFFTCKIHPVFRRRVADSLIGGLTYGLLDVMNVCSCNWYQYAHTDNSSITSASPSEPVETRRPSSPSVTVS